MFTKSLPIALLATLALCGCKKNEASTTPEGSASARGLLGQAAEKASEDAQTAKSTPMLPQPDTSRPLSSYPEIKSGMQIMFLYVGASRLPPDFANLAETYSSEYRETSDSFRKSDLMKAIQPQLVEKIADATLIPYGWMDIDDSDNLNGYDFERKGFPIQEFQSELSRYINDAYEYKLTWTNHAQVAFAPVPDETVARQLESMRTKYDNRPRLKIYFFAQSADLNSKKVNALVTRVQITDKSGRVLAEYGPDGSVPVESVGKDEGCQGDAAACAANAASGM